MGNIGATVSASFAAVNAFSWLLLHGRKLFLVRIGLNGVNNVATML